MASECNKPQPPCKLLCRNKVVSICFCLIYFQIKQTSFVKSPQIVWCNFPEWLVWYNFPECPPADILFIRCSLWLFAPFKHTRWEWVLLFMNTLPELKINFVFSYSVTYTVIWIQVGIVAGTAWFQALCTFLDCCPGKGQIMPVCSYIRPVLETQDLVHTTWAHEYSCMSFMLLTSTSSFRMLLLVSRS